MSYRSDELPIKIEVAKAPILAIAYQEKRLIITCVDGEAMTAVE